jgi:two-component system nitrate/nitrite response regulator NarL
VRTRYDKIGTHPDTVASAAAQRLSPEKQKVQGYSGRAFAISKGPAPPPKPFEWFHLLRLSPRERDICELIPTRLSYKEIGRSLGITESTVKTNMRRILLKVDAENRYALISALYAVGYKRLEKRSPCFVSQAQMERRSA